MKILLIIKKIVFAIVISASAVEAFSQIEKDNIIITANGNYLKTGTDNGLTLNNFKTSTKNLNLGISIGVFLTDRFIAGFGIDYNRVNESALSEVYINRYLQLEKADIKDRLLAANIFTGYYFPILKNFYFNTGFRVSYGKIQSENNSYVIGRSEPVDDGIHVIDDYYSIIRVTRTNSATDVFGAGLTPEIVYFISGHFALSLNLGGIEYLMADWNWQNSNWAVDFRPSYWKPGVKIKF